MKKLLGIVIFTVMATPAWAAMQTVTLQVPGMTCGACPITIKKALSKVAGVTKIVVDDQQRTAVVTFDNAKVSTNKLTDATANAGYPSTIKP